jgi:signal transduction histidine kinase
MSGVMSTVGRASIGLASLGAATCMALVALTDADVFTVAVAVEALLIVPLAIVGAGAVRTAPRNAVGWLLLTSGAFMPLAIAAFLYGKAAFDHGYDLPLASLAGWLDGWPWVPAQLAVALFVPLLLPDGHLPSSRWRSVVVVDMVICTALLLSTLLDPHLLDWPHRANPTGVAGDAGDAAHILFGVIVLVAPMTLAGAIAFELRARRLEDPALASAMRLVRPAVWALVLSWWVCDLLALAGADTANSLPFESLGMATVGLTCGVAIRRYGLFDARLTIRRGLVYGALSGCILAAYAVVALVLTRLGATEATTPVALIVAILAAVPLRDRLQRTANRLVFGLRDDPVATMISLGDQLERAAAVDAVLPAAVLSLQRTLRLQHVSVHDNDGVVAASAAPGRGPRTEVPLVYAGEQIGVLVAVQAEGDTVLDTERRRLLAGVGRPIAAALRTAGLSHDLAASREHLVEATEEERRRLRRDLHDGLGPTLSSTVLGVHRAKALLASRPDAAEDQLDQVSLQLQQAVGDVRRLVYALRPPVLDHLGLVGALDEQARSLGGFAVSGPATMPRLSAAAEVAAYRIAMEAMNNALRHANAHSGSVTITVDDGLHLVVSDDGVGLPAGYRSGVGITSMRERAVELGGTCVIEGGPAGGTVVRAWLPL